MKRNKIKKYYLDQIYNNKKEKQSLTDKIEYYP